MAEKTRNSPLLRWTAFLAFLAAAILALRSLGPGGAPTEEPRSPPPAPSVSGKVLDGNGAPAAGVTVEATFEAPAASAPSAVVPRAVRAGPDGRFSIAGEGRCLGVRAFRGPLSVEADLRGMPAVPGPRVVLDLRLPAAFTVGGLVVAAEDGRPLEGMEVVLGERKARTDALGRFSLGELPASLLEGPLPPLEVKGAGRRAQGRRLPGTGRLDDLLIRAEAE